MSLNRPLRLPTRLDRCAGGHIATFVVVIGVATLARPAVAGAEGNAKGVVQQDPADAEPRTNEQEEDTGRNVAVKKPAPRPSVIPVVVGAVAGGGLAATYVTSLGVSAVAFFLGATRGFGVFPAEYAYSMVFFGLAAPLGLLALLVGPLVYSTRVFVSDAANPWLAAGALLAIGPAALALALYLAVPPTSLLFLSGLEGFSGGAVVLGASAVVALLVPAVAIVGDYGAALYLAPGDDE